MGNALPIDDDTVVAGAILADVGQLVVRWVAGTALDTVWRVLEDNRYAAKPTGGE